MTRRFFGIWLLWVMLLIPISTAGLCGEIHLMLPERGEAEEKEQNPLGSLGKAIETYDTLRPYSRETRDAEIEKAWAKVTKPISISVAGGVYSEDQAAVDAFIKGFIRRLTETNEFGITYTSSRLDREEDDPSPSYVLNMLIDEAKGGLYYGYVSINRVYHICRCKDGFEFRLSEEVPFSTDIFCNYAFSGLVELGAQYAQQTHHAIERDLLKDMGFFWFEGEEHYRTPLKKDNTFWLATGEPAPASEIGK